MEPCHLTRLSHLDHAIAPPFGSSAPGIRSDQRENHESGTLITRYSTEAPGQFDHAARLFARIGYCWSARSR